MSAAGDRHWWRRFARHAGSEARSQASKDRLARSPNAAGDRCIEEGTGRDQRYPACNLLVSGQEFPCTRVLGDSTMAKPKVILFDVNETLLDLSALKGSVGQALGGHPELMPL